MKYRKKPVEVEAIQYVGDNRIDICNFMKCRVTPYQDQLMIYTLAGSVFVNVGDYIIKGIKGEFYLCKQEEFEQTYEVVE